MSEQPSSMPPAILRPVSAAMASDLPSRMARRGQHAHAAALTSRRSCVWPLEPGNCVRRHAPRSCWRPCHRSPGARPRCLPVTHHPVWATPVCTALLVNGHMAEAYTVLTQALQAQQPSVSPPPREGEGERPHTPLRLPGHQELLTYARGGSPARLLGVPGHFFNMVICVQGAWRSRRAVRSETCGTRRGLLLGTTWMFLISRQVYRVEANSRNTLANAWSESIRKSPQCGAGIAIISPS